MNITLLDGGMGQELVSRSSEKATELWSIQYLLDAPELVEAVHTDFFKAGADVATVNSYSIHRDRLKEHDLQDRFENLHELACELAVKARDKHGMGLVAGALGPIGWTYRPDLAPQAERAAEMFSEIALIQKPYVDIIICETMSSVEEARGAVLGASVAGKPVWLAVSVDDEDGTRLRSGEPVQSVLNLFTDCKIDALLVNCSFPEAVSQAIPLLDKCPVPVGGYANGFGKIPEEFKQKGATVTLLQKRKHLTPEIYAKFAGDWISKGASIIGGCCEVGPSHIEALAKAYKPIV